MTPELLDQFERLVRRDPGQRGLLGQAGAANQFGAGAVSGAARELAERAKSVVLVTGFYIHGAETPSCETDGPPGTLYLAKLLAELDIEVHVVTDVHAESAVRSAASHVQFAGEVHVIPLQPESGWVREFYSEGAGRRLTHLISIERPGPGYTTSIFQARFPDIDPGDFLKQVPVERQGSCHNMRGLTIDEWHAPLYELFEQLPDHHPHARTIGIGDGGNEIGMGQLDWRQILDCLPMQGTSHIPCRVATDELIVAGTSNWGAMALTAALAAWHDRADILVPWTAEHHEEMLAKMVVEGPAVDGVTGKLEPTVDGIPFLTYIQPWLLMRKLLGLEQ